MRRTKRWIAGLCAVVCVAGMSTIGTTMDTKAEVAAAQNSAAQNGIAVPTVANLEFTYDNYGKQDGALVQGATENKIPLKVSERTALNVLVFAYTASSAAVQTVNCNVTKADGAPLATTALQTKNTAATKIGDYTQILCNAVVEPGEYLVQLAGQNLSANVGYRVLAIGYQAPVEQEAALGANLSGYAAKNECIYKKITLDSDGELTVRAKQYPATAYWTAGTSTQEGANVTLCDAQKKPLSTGVVTVKSTEYEQTYTLKKGTYYVQITGTDCFYFFGTGFAGGTLCQTKKANASILTDEGEEEILPLDGTTSSGWYKFTLKKAKKITLTTEFFGTGAIKVVVYKGTAKKANSKYFGSGSSYVCTMKNKRTGKKAKWAKGTYYVKIMRNAKTTSGTVSVSM